MLAADWRGCKSIADLQSSWSSGVKLAKSRWLCAFNLGTGASVSRGSGKARVAVLDNWEDSPVKY